MESLENKKNANNESSEKKVSHYCDCCGAFLEGDFETLVDGREICDKCRDTSIKLDEEFEELLEDVRNRMEKIFNIRFFGEIRICGYTATGLAEALGGKFKPTCNFDARVISATQYEEDASVILIETFISRRKAELALVHELTHIWQHSNLPNMFSSKELCSMEGMALWVELQYFVSIGEKDFAKTLFYSREYSNDYGSLGCKMYLERFRLRESSKVYENTPFVFKRNPLFGFYVGSLGTRDFDEVFVTDIEEMHYCDFCGKRTYDYYDVLDDGRERCINCGKTAITEKNDYRKLWNKTRKRVRRVFGIKIRAKVSIVVSDAKDIADYLNEKFEPTFEHDIRSFYLLQYISKYKYQLYIEGGLPALLAELEMVRALAGLWLLEHERANDSFASGDKSAREIMNRWIEEQYLTSTWRKKYIRKNIYDKFYKNENMRKYFEVYPIRKKRRVQKGTPFRNDRKSDARRVIL